MNEGVFDFEEEDGDGVDLNAAGEVNVVREVNAAGEDNVVEVADEVNQVAEVNDAQVADEVNQVADKVNVAVGVEVNDGDHVDGHEAEDGVHVDAHAEDGGHVADVVVQQYPGWQLFTNRKRRPSERIRIMRKTVLNKDGGGSTAANPVNLE